MENQDIHSGTELTPAIMSTLDMECSAAWARTYERTNPGASYVVWRYTVAGTLIFQGGYAFHEDALDALNRAEKRHPQRLYFIWTVPDPPEA